MLEGSAWKLSAMYYFLTDRKSGSSDNHGSAIAAEAA
jgi:hypothetical protein